VAYRLAAASIAWEASLWARHLRARASPRHAGHLPEADGPSRYGVVATVGTDGAADKARSEYVSGSLRMVGIYGGHAGVFRNMIAQYVLGLGKPGVRAVGSEEGSRSPPPRVCRVCTEHAPQRGPLCAARGAWLVALAS